MINLFQFAGNDKSLVYLSQIFGSMNGIIPAGSVGGSISLLGNMFKTFNSVVLVVGVLIVVYAVVIGVIKTAHEGQFMGKQGGNIWIPIRIVLGIAALVPSGSGYSGLQIIMMWVIVQGIGAADTIWNTASSYVNIAGSPYAQLTIPNSDAAYVMEALFKGLVCDATAKEDAADPSNTKGGGYYCNQHNDAGFCTGPNTTGNNFNPEAGSYSLGPSGTCGTLKFCQQSSDCAGSATANSLSCAACKGQQAALKDIVPTLSGVAMQFRDADFSYREFFAKSYNAPSQHSDWSWIYNYCSAKGIAQSKCCNASSAPPGLISGATTCQANTGKDKSGFPSPNKADGSPQSPSDAAVEELYWPYNLQPALGDRSFINTAVNYYLDQVTNQITLYIAQQGQASSLSGILEEAQSTGWILAGGYYYYLSKMNSNNLQDAVPELSMNASNPNASTEMGGVRNNFDAADKLISVASGAKGMFSAVPSLSSFNGPLGAALESIAKAFANGTSNLTGGSGGGDTSNSPPNPLVQLQLTGSIMSMVAVRLFMVLVPLTFGLSFAGNLDFWAEGYGYINPFGPAFSLTSMLIFPVVFGLLGLLVTLGGLLGVYTPLIPYVFFTMGAIGWLISTIEAMVAGPLVALGILSPSQHGHDILGKAEGALLMLFSIFLRPGLMIFGLMAAILLAGVVVSMINTAFWSIVVVGIESMSVPANLPKEAVVAAAALKLANDPIALLLFLVAYVALVIVALNKSFAVIYLIPQGAIRWIGGNIGEAGETEAIGSVKGALGAAEGKVTGGMQHGLDTAQKMGGEAAGIANKAKAKAAETVKGVGMTGVTKKPPGG